MRVPVVGPGALMSGLAISGLAGVGRAASGSGVATSGDMVVLPLEVVGALVVPGLLETVRGGAGLGVTGAGVDDTGRGMAEIGRGVGVV